MSSQRVDNITSRFEDHVYPFISYGEFRASTSLAKVTLTFDPSIVLEMTYSVSSATLNPPIPYHLDLKTAGLVRY